MARLRAEERRRQLLETAAEVFAQRGFHGTTTRALADAAGITEPILYQHFDNKLDLFTTLIREVGREVIAGWQARLEEAPTPEARLTALLGANPATHERGRGVYRVIFQAMTDSAVDQRVRRAINQHIRELHRVIASEIASLQKQKVVRHDRAADELSWMLVETAIGVGMLAPMKLGSAAKSSNDTSTRRMLEQMLRA